MKVTQSNYVEGSFSIQIKDKEGNIKQDIPFQKNLITNLGLTRLFNNFSFQNGGEEVQPFKTSLNESFRITNPVSHHFKCKKFLPSANTPFNMYYHLDLNDLYLGLGTGSTTINENTYKFKTLIDFIGGAVEYPLHTFRYVYSKPNKKFYLQQDIDFSFTTIAFERVVDKPITEIGIIGFPRKDVYKLPTSQYYSDNITLEQPTDNLEKYNVLYHLFTIARLKNQEGQNYSITLDKGDILTIQYKLTNYIDITPKKHSFQVVNKSKTNGETTQEFEALIWKGLFMSSSNAFTQPLLGRVFNNYYNEYRDVVLGYYNDGTSRSSKIDLDKLEINLEVAIKRFGLEVNEENRKVTHPIYCFRYPNYSMTVESVYRNKAQSEGLELFTHESHRDNVTPLLEETFKLFKSSDKDYLKQTLLLGTSLYSTDWNTRLTASSQSAVLAYRDSKSSELEPILTLNQVQGTKDRIKTAMVSNLETGLKGFLYINENGHLTDCLIGTHNFVTTKPNWGLGFMSIDTSGYNLLPSLFTTTQIWFSEQETKKGISIGENQSFSIEFEFVTERVSDADVL